MRWLGEVVVTVWGCAMAGIVIRMYVRFLSREGKDPNDTLFWLCIWGLIVVLLVTVLGIVGVGIIGK